MLTVPLAFQERVDDVKRGVLQAGGFPMELPAMSLSETFVKPTTMLYRNMLAMEAEELIRSHPVDGVVLMGGCDKTTPGLADGRDQRRPSDDLSAGRPDAARQLEAARCWARAPTPGNTGTSAAPARSPTRTGSTSKPASPAARHLHDHGHRFDHDRDRGSDRHDAARRVVHPGRRCQPHPHGRRCGRRVVEMVWEDLTPARIQSRKAYENAIAVAMAMGCSTNAVIHLIAHGASRRTGHRARRLR